jgi:pimeloyl-ACP methyl ester carboxylesterase
MLEPTRLIVRDTAVDLLRDGSGPALLYLHGAGAGGRWLTFQERLAERFTVLAPSHPGHGASPAAEWIEHISDLAFHYLDLLDTLGLERVHVVGASFGGWIAAEMATMSPQAFRRLVLVGAMGVKPKHGEILDQALVSYIAYVRAGFVDQSVFDRVYGADPPTPLLEQWDLNREMTFRIAWKPYMYNPTLPHLLGGVRARSLIVWGRDDKVVPLECGEEYARALPGSRLSVVERAGHFVDMEQPEALAKLISEFAAES